jgi:hypothetical protein
MSIIMPAASVKNAKPLASHGPEIFFWRKSPIMSPISEKPIISKRNHRSTASGIYPSAPIDVFIEMINIDVTSAFLLARPPKRISAGTMRNPPPAPTSPVRDQTPIPCSIVRRRVVCVGSIFCATVFRFLQSMAQLAPNITTANITRSNPHFSIPNIVSGSAGTHQRRMLMVARIDGMPKRNHIFHSTFFVARIVPMKDVTPTIIML